MAGEIAGRKVRIKYDSDGAGAGAAVEIARAKADSGTINNEAIDATTKDDAGVRTYLNDIGVKSMSLSCSGILSDGITTLIGLAANAGDGTALHWFELDIEGLGTFRGQFFITTFTPGGNEGAEAATFEMALESSGAIAWS
ncbi:putative secreted protein [Defluviimonas denitrificans]|jgi:predicted secreted protein|uniref:Putative secreted protein n=1 Tax=Albidovulum denitrificans TaxID=404881 RepID=A0A2S8RWJ0_9RHOB|nr:phage tail tube protein [Defluviimonas denitrificans]PQV52893.1 putative secreted protein [Defluviimonas denitrificans]